jgi:hypothetical protein
VRQDQLETVFAGVAGTADEQFAVPGGRKRRQGQRARRQTGWQQGSDRVARLRTLHRQDAEIAALIDVDAVSRGLPAQPGQILVGGAGIDHQPEPLLANEVDDEIVDDTAGLVQHARVQCFTAAARGGGRRLAGQPELGHIIGQQVPQELARARPVQVDNAHVRHVEHAGGLAYRVMLVKLRGVLDRHFPAGKIDQPGAKGLVFGVQRGFLEHAVRCHSKSIVPNRPSVL